MRFLAWVTLLASISSALIADDVEKFFSDGVEEVSMMATSTGLNIDDMPSTATILTRQRLETLGAATLKDAIDLIPGVEVSRESGGPYELVVRGVKEKGKVKLLIDGVVISNAFRGSIYHYFDFPVDLIERVEVIKSPATSLYGEGAIAGVINVTTRSRDKEKDNTLILEGGKKGNSVSGGAGVIIQAADVRADGYTYKGGSDFRAGPDKGGFVGVADDRYETSTAGVSMDKGIFSLVARVKKSRAAIPYGLGGYLEQTGGTEGNTHDSGYMAVAAKFTPTPRVNVEVQAGVSYFDQEIDAWYAPAPSPQGDLRYGIQYKERGGFVDVKAKVDRAEAHAITVGARYENIRVEGDLVYAYYNESGASVLSPGPVLDRSPTRGTFSLFAMDRYQVSRQLTLNAGLRYDSFSDAGDVVSPTLAAIYRVSQGTRVKFAYSRSYRAPSLAELYGAAPGVSIGDETLEKESVDTAELGVTVAKGQDKVRMSVFASEVDGLIVRDPITKRYVKGEGRQNWGGEVEWERHFGTASTASASISYVDGRQDAGVVDVANWMGDLSFTTEFDPGVSVGLVAKYVGQRERTPGDLRPDAEEYCTVDASVSKRFQNLMVSISVYNAFGNKIVYPSPPGTYLYDYTEERRAILMKASVKF